MAKDKSEKKEKKEKKEKREKDKEKLSDKNGIHKSSKKDKKEKKLVVGPDAAEQLLQDIEKREANVDIKPQPAPEPNGDMNVDVEVVNKEELVVVQVKPLGALVPFANPLADEKVGKKVFKSVKKGILDLSSLFLSLSLSPF